MDKNRIKEFVNSHGPLVVERVGRILNPLVLKIKNENNRLLVFYFHGLYKSERDKEMNHVDPQNNMTVQQFERFIEYFLRYKYKFIIPEDLENGLDGTKPYAMVTFDDGYFNNMLSLEILEKYKIPAVFFITTGNVRENNSYWWDIIFKYRTKNGHSLENIRKEQNTLKSYKHQEIKDYIVRNFGISSFNPWSDIDRPFSEDEVKLLKKYPYITIGNHTQNHSILTNYLLDEIKDELNGSNRILFDWIGKYPSSLAYPNGNFNNMVLKIAEEVGFKFVFTTIPKTNMLSINHNNSLLSLNRFMASIDRINKFGSFCRIGYSPDYYFFDVKDRIASFIKVRK